jgi:hypothetical protein
MTRICAIIGTPMLFELMCIKLSRYFYDLPYLAYK